jgi:hypothetical protein
MTNEEWKPGQFTRRSYVIRDDRLDGARRVEIIVRVDGQTMVQVQAREPGMIAFVSRPDEPGFEIDVVEAGSIRYTDVKLPPGKGAVLPWQREALFGPREKLEGDE